MSNLLAARSQMAMSLAFHILFAAAGIAMPLMMVIAEWRWLRTRDEVWLTLAKRWAKGTAILFAVGADLSQRRSGASVAHRPTCASYCWYRLCRWGSSGVDRVN